MPVGKTYVKIASQTLGSNTQTVTFSNIPQNFTDLIVVLSAAGSGGPYNTAIRINGDTTTSYSDTSLGTDGTTTPISSRSTSTSQTSPYVYGALGTTLGYGVQIYQFMNYSNGNVYKTILGRTSNATHGVGCGVGLWRSASPITSISFNYDNFANNRAQWITGSTFTLYGIEAARSPKADGGDTITTDGTYWYHTFKTSGAFSTKQSLTCDYLVVAGGGCGGGAGFSSWGYGGGGGAGGLVYASSQSLSGSYAVTVGGGGIFASGSNSSISSSTATGGGRGGYYTGSAYANGSSGGSGGGGGTSNASTGGAASPAGQGNAGGAGDGTNNNGGGGGGASAAGNAGSANGNGGAGSSTYSSWGTATGTGQNVSNTYYYAGGGGGMKGNFGTGAGGNGGGGQGSQSSGSVGTSGTANTGGGGGGAFAGNGQTPGLGGSGIVIVRYAV